MNRSRPAGASGENLDGVEICWNRMRQNFLVELFAKDDDVLKMLPGHSVCRAPVVPDLCLAQNSESRHVDHAGSPQRAIACKENGDTENSLERANEPSILLTALYIPNVSSISEQLLKRIVWLRCWTASVARKMGTIRSMAEREAIVRMASDLQRKMSIGSFEQKLTRWRSLHRKTTQNEGPRTESEILVSPFTLQMEHLGLRRVAGAPVSRFLSCRAAG